MTDDTIWENASIGERCEILRSELRMLNATLNITSNACDERTKTIGEKLRFMEHPSGPVDDSGFVKISAGEYDQLVRIKAAATELERRRIPGMPWSDLYEPIKALSKALWS